MKPGTRRLRNALRRLKRPTPEPPQARPAPGWEWGWSIEGRLRDLEARLARLERLIGGGVLVTVLVEVGLKVLEKWLS